MADLDLDVAVIGAGFAGMYALHRIRGLGLKVKVFEAAEGVGGTWYWNRYPGARCDVESLEYSYQFSEELQQEWEWTERYASQPEILRYLNHIADRFSLRPDIQLRTRIESAHLQEPDSHWRLQTSAGETITSRWLVMATGCLSKAHKPSLPGAEHFGGDVLHTARWPHEPVDFGAKRVAVIGTGSSGIQCIPEIARGAEQLTVFQRSAAYSAPAHNGPMDPEVQRSVKADYAGFRAHCSAQLAAINTNSSKVSALEVTPKERRRVYEERWARGGLAFTGAFGDIRLSLEANATAADFVREKIREVVSDPEIAQRLFPRTLFACKRLCVDTNYYRTFNESNVTLVDLAAEPITAVTSAGIATTKRVFEFDTLVFATGFDAMTGALLAIDIRGSDGLKLRDAWHGGPRTYLGLLTAGFPNLFLVTGPGSPSVLANMVVAIEHHVNWIVDCIKRLESRGVKRFEAKSEYQDAWVDHVNELANKTLFTSASSWYLGANIPGKPRVFMPYVGGFPAYVEKCREVFANGLVGFQSG